MIKQNARSDKNLHCVLSNTESGKCLDFLLQKLNLKGVLNVCLQTIEFEQGLYFLLTECPFNV